MAFIDTDSVDAVKAARFYNVTSAVGYGGKNMMEDVKIVQFFLQRYFLCMKAKKPWGEMVVDGKCGPITRAWITSAQFHMKRTGVPMIIDGVIDKAGNAAGNRNASITRTEYAIRILNNALRHLDMEVYKNLTTHPAVPSDLKLIFLKIQAAGPPMTYGKQA